MSTIRTAITRLIGMQTIFVRRMHSMCTQAPILGIKTPIVLAPMGGASGGALASQVSLAGGFGFLAPGPGEA